MAPSRAHRSRAFAGGDVEAEAALLAFLSSPDDLVVCGALKHLARLDPISDRAVGLIAACTRSDTLAVERTALVTLAKLGPRASDQALPLVTWLAHRLQDAGCVYSCCGYQAFHGPVEQYILALRSMMGVLAEREFLSVIEPLDVSRGDREFIAHLFFDEA